MFPSMVIRYNMGWYEMLLIDVPLFFAATMSVCNFYMVCQREIYKEQWITRLKYLPFLMSIGIGLCVNNARAVLEALFGKQTEFARTPKYRIEQRQRRVDRQEVPAVGHRSSRSSSWRSGSISPSRCSTRWRTGSTARCRSWCCSRSASSTRACSRSSSSSPTTASC